MHHSAYSFRPGLAHRHRSDRRNRRQASHFARLDIECNRNKFAFEPFYLLSWLVGRSFVIHYGMLSL